MAFFKHTELQDRDEDREILIRYLLDELSADAYAVVEDRLERDAALHAKLDRMRAVQVSLLSRRAKSFGPYFKERLLERLHPVVAADAAQVLYDSLRTVFARVAIAGLIAATALGALNLMTYSNTDVASSVPEAVFGLPSASLMDALDYNVY